MTYGDGNCCNLPSRFQFDPAYNVENFCYFEQGDYYVCPQGEKLTTPGTWHKTRTYHFKRYTTRACISCLVKDQCSKAKYGKGIQRSEYQQYIIDNKERIEQNKDYYRQRQAIVEHPYGTIKRQWGFSYILTKKYKQRAEADVGLMFVAYNLRRMINILGKDVFKKYLRILVAHLLLIIAQLRAILSRFKKSNGAGISNLLFFEHPANQLIFTRKLTGMAGF